MDVFNFCFSCCRRPWHRSASTRRLVSLWGAPTSHPIRSPRRARGSCTWPLRPPVIWQYRKPRRKSHASSRMNLYDWWVPLIQLSSLLAPLEMSFDGFYIKMNFDFKSIHLSHGYTCLTNDMHYSWFVDNPNIFRFYLVTTNQSLLNLMCNV